jgi:hypothetical protein
VARRAPVVGSEPFAVDVSDSRRGAVETPFVATNWFRAWSRNVRGKDQKLLTIQSFCSDLLTELPYGRFAGISRAIRRNESPGIEFY